MVTPGRLLLMLSFLKDCVHKATAVWSFSILLCTPAGCMKGHATNVVQVAMRDQHCLLVHCLLRAPANVQGKLAPRQDEAGLLQDIK